MKVHKLGHQRFNLSTGQRTCTATNDQHMRRPRPAAHAGLRDRGTHRGLGPQQRVREDDLLLVVVVVVQKVRKQLRDGDDHVSSQSSLTGRERWQGPAATYAAVRQEPSEAVAERVDIRLSRDRTQRTWTMVSAGQRKPWGPCTRMCLTSQMTRMAVSVW